MSLLTSLAVLTVPLRVRRPQPSGPLAPPLRLRIQLSADILAALLEVEGRQRPTLDDLEWADAVATRLAKRQAARCADQAACASTSTTPRRKPATARRALDRTGSSATSAT